METLSLRDVETKSFCCFLFREQDIFETYFIQKLWFLDVSVWK